MSTKFSIGEFATLHGVSKQTLIYYDNIGLFKPKLQDKNNKYRYYTLDQVELFDAIHTLKEIGVPLKEIKHYLENRNLASVISLLKEQHLIVKSQISKLQRIDSIITQQLDMLNEISHVKNFDKIAIQYANSKYLLCHQVNTNNQNGQVELSIKELLSYISQYAIPVTYQIGVIIDKEDLLISNFSKIKKVFTIASKDLIDPSIQIKPAGLYATIYHKGAYANIVSSYETLIGYVTTHNYTIIGDSYELCIRDSFTTLNENDYLTEVNIPIAPV